MSLDPHLLKQGPSLRLQSEGLDEESARTLLEKFGPNEIQRQRSRPVWRLLAEQFQSPLVLILLAACAIAGVLGEWLEVAAIGAILLLNAVIGFFQEYRAETAIGALKRMAAPHARVVRGGRQRVVLAREVVPGDLLLLEAGDMVAADSVLLQATQLQVNEAILTGESLPVAKSADGRVFMGTPVVAGTGLALVEKTGMATEFGRIAHLLATAEETQTPLQQQLAKMGRILLVLCLCIAAVVLVLGVLHGRPFLEIAVFSMSLAVAAVPEGMPTIVTLALAMGVQRMVQRNALVRKLPSVETLGSVSVICTDKTGTLTAGKMEVREVWATDTFETLRVAASCCDAELDASGKKGTGDPTEVAILVAALGRGISREQIERENPRVETQPFDSKRMRMSIYRRDQCLYVKGAVEAILPLCQLSDDRCREIEAANRDLSSRGMRVLSVAQGSSREERDLGFVGLIGFADPPRTEVIPAIEEAHAAGITTVMITGDHPDTAAAIAREVGLIDESEATDGRVHARARPEDKLKLVREWKSRGEVVAMTGDGVNDAPALREAHIGIAMGRTGTEVTREAADLILVDDNFATIVSAVREGRTVYTNVRRAVTYLLTGNLAEVGLVIGASVLGAPVPLLAMHLLWINLVTDSLPGIALIAEPTPSGIMARKPRPLSEPLITRSLWIQIIAVGAIEAACCLLLFLWSLKNDGLEIARNLTFLALVLSQLLRAFAARSRTEIVWKLGFFTNLWLLGVIVVTGVLQISLHYVPFMERMLGLRPLEFHEVALAFGVALIPVTVMEVRKLVRR